jgi:hypothetical protein
MKLCKDCKYNTQDLFCKSPENGISPVDGQPNIRGALLNRNTSTSCGPEGVFFKDIEESKKEWWRFWIT